MPRKNRQWYPVRCCCKPQKILGFLRMETNPEWDEFSVVDCNGKKHDIQMKTFSHVATPLFHPDPMDMDRELCLPVIHEYAIYSDDRPIEFWRTIEEFVEVSQ